MTENSVLFWKQKMKQDLDEHMSNIMIHLKKKEEHETEEKAGICLILFLFFI